MHPRKRWIWFVALVTAAALSAACGGQAADTAEEQAPAPAVEEQAPAAEVAPAPEPEPMPEEPAAPAAPQLQGTIVEEAEAHEMVWLTAATREVPAKYYWVVRLRNDTTQTLNITVNFQFLDEEDGVVKTDRKTMQLPPAGAENFRVEGEMGRDDARAVISYTYTWDWEIVEGS